MASNLQALNFYDLKNLASILAATTITSALHRLFIKQTPEHRSQAPRQEAARQGDSEMVSILKLGKQTNSKTMSFVGYPF